MGKAKWLHEQRRDEVEDYLSKDDVILLPTGTVEQHGLHLPLMTDTAQAIALAEAVSEKTGIMIAPPIWYGWTPHHMSYKGSTTLRPETLAALVEDVCLSLIHHGFDRVFVISGHRSMNYVPMEPAINRVRFQTGAYVALIDIIQIARLELSEIVECEVGEMGHACELETSVMLAIRPDLVDMKKAKKGIRVHQEQLMQRLIISDPRVNANRFSFYPTADEFAVSTRDSDGMHGNPTKASADKGKRVLEAQVKNTLKAIEISRKAKIKVFNRPIPV